MNKFTFYPVGQGLFYAGQLEYRHCIGRYTFIFDCGGEENYIKKAALKFRYETNHVNLCVISHLHKDHYNGLRYLKEAGISFDKIILPYLPEDYRYRDLKTVYIVGQYSERLSGEDYNDGDIVNLRLMLGFYNVIARNEFQREVHSFQEGKHINGSLYFEYQNALLLSDNKWIYEIYNKSITDEKWDYFNQKLNAYMKENNIDSVLSLFPENVGKLVEIYKTVFGKYLNDTSIVMKHYFAEKTYGYHPAECKSFLFAKYYFPIEYYMAFEKRNKNLSVLTGDAEFDNYLRERIFNNFSDISVLQLPHHGAKSNWNKMQLPQGANCSLVASFGLGNEYKHPNSKVVNEILSNYDCELISVTQAERYEYLIVNR